MDEESLHDSCSIFNILLLKTRILTKSYMNSCKVFKRILAFYSSLQYLHLRKEQYLWVVKTHFSLKFQAILGVCIDPSTLGCLRDVHRLTKGNLHQYRQPPNRNESAGPGDTVIFLILIQGEVLQPLN